MILKAWKFAAVLLVTLVVSEPALAQNTPGFRLRIPNNPVIRRVLPPTIKPPLPLLGVKIRPSQAAAIAQGQVPNSTVVGVKLLPSGTYAVTLRTETSVERVMVNGEDGSTN
jgi:hypothetical protein